MNNHLAEWRPKTKPFAFTDLSVDHCYDVIVLDRIRVDLPNERPAHGGWSDRPSPWLSTPDLLFGFWWVLSGVRGDQDSPM